MQYRITRNGSGIVVNDSEIITGSMNAFREGTITIVIRQIEKEVLRIGNYKDILSIGDNIYNGTERLDEVIEDLVELIGSTGEMSGVAGGDLEGTYPNPTIKESVLTPYELSAHKVAALGTPNNTEFPTTALMVATVNAALISGSAADKVKTATRAVLPNSPTYNNGTAGVGATLTAGTNAALVVNGYAVSLNDRILVGNQASSFQNGIYTVTTVGSAGAAWVLTRATDYDEVSNINATKVIPVETYVNTNGNTETTTFWLLLSTVTTIGTDGILFIKGTTGTEITALNTTGLAQFLAAGTTAAQLQVLLSDKTLVFRENNNTFTKAQRSAQATITDQATVTFDMDAANDHVWVIGGNRLLGEPTNIANNQCGIIDIWQNDTGGFAPSYEWCWIFQGGISPTITATKNTLTQCPYRVVKYATANVTISIATPGVVTWNNHGLISGQRIRLATTGALPTGLSINSTYWIHVVNANTFQLSTSKANLDASTYVATSGTQSGVHTARCIMIYLTSNPDLS